MEFKTNKDSLAKVLVKAINGIAKKNTLGILENFLLSLKDDILTVTATDLHYTILASAKIDNSITEGNAIINAAKMTEIVKQMDEKHEIHFKVEDDIGIIVNGTFESKFSLQNIEEFPALPEFESSETASLSSDKFLYLLQNTSFAISDANDGAPITGAFWDIQNKNMIMVGINGTILATAWVGLQDDEEGFSHSVIIPSKAIALVEKFAHESENITVETNENQAKISMNDMIIYTKLIDGDYPGYKDFIKIERPNTLEVNAKDLAHAMKLVGISSDDSSKVLLDIKEKEIVISSRSPESDATQTIPCEYDGDQITFGLNYKLVGSIIKQIETENVNIELPEGNTVTIKFQSTDTDNDVVGSLFLLAPIRLVSEEYEYDSEASKDEEPNETEDE